MIPEELIPLPPDLKKKLPLLPRINLTTSPERSPSLKIDSLVGKKAFNRLKPLAKTDINQEYNQILFLETNPEDPEDNPFDFNSILILRQPIFVKQNSFYFIGFDERGRVYLFSPLIKSEIYDLFANLIITNLDKEKRKTLLINLKSKLFKMFKQELDNKSATKNIFLVNDPDSDENLKEIVEKLIDSYHYLFRLLNAK